MIMNRRTKRILSISLLVLGGMLMFFAPENIWIGAILFTLGVGVEIVGSRARTAAIVNSNSDYRRIVRGTKAAPSFYGVAA